MSGGMTHGPDGFRPAPAPGTNPQTRRVACGMTPFAPVRALAVGLLVLLLPPVASAQVQLDGRRCATPSPTVAQSMERAAIVQRHRDLSALRLGPDAPVTVPVAVHVLTDGSRGDVPLAMLEAQVDTLNSAFRTTGFRFALAVVNRVDNAEWYDDLRLGSGEERAMKRALQIGRASCRERV